MKPLNRYFDAIARPAFERHGHAWAGLLRNWRQIAPQLATFCVPEKLTVPRGARGRAPGGTLHLRVMPARALELQHMQTELIARINAFFGYAAVQRITFVQAPLDTPSAKPPPPRPDPALQKRLQERAGQVSDPALRESLTRLAEAVSARESAAKP